MLKPHDSDHIPAETVRIAKAAFPKGNRLLTFRDEFGKLYSDEDFREFFSYAGQPALAAWRLALVTTGIEGTFSQGVRTHDLRHSRYRGLPKTHLQHVVTATAINLQPLADWFSDVPRAQTRTSRFAQLFA